MGEIKIVTELMGQDSSRCDPREEDPSETLPVTGVAPMDTADLFSCDIHIV